jgi:hypothetical protein
VSAAIAQSDIFKTINASHGGIALDLPALVHTMATPSGYDYYDDDHWVVSVRDGKSQQVGLYDFVYDRANSRVRFASYGALTPKDPRFGHAFPSVAPSAAIDRLQAERRLAAKAGVQPDLVFFPLADDVQGGQVTRSWTGGGSPMDAMWRVTGTDGATYFIGQDLHVYDYASLPIKAGRP